MCIRDSTEAVLGDVIAFKNTTNYPTVGRPIYCTIKITTPVTGTNADVIFAIKSAPGANVTADSPTTHWTSAAIPVATLVAGYVVFQGTLPLGAYQKYLGVTTLPDETLTGGAADVFITDDVSAWRAYADAIA